MNSALSIPSLCLAESAQLRYTTAAGYVWETSGPFLILHYYDRQHPRAQLAEIPASESHAFGTAGTPSLSANADWSVEETGSGEFRLRALFTNIHIGLEVIVRPSGDGNGFSLRIEDGGIREDMPELYRVLGVEMLPEFEAATTGEAGYLTLPNWSGCQTHFDKSYPREVRQTIYSSNDQWEYACSLPVFGITRSKGTLCGLVSHGDFDAQLVCRVHWEDRHNNSVHPHLVYRWEQQDEMIRGLREVRYTFSPPEYDGGEGYVFCGNACRKFLREERRLLSWQEKTRQRPEAAEYRDRFFLKLFLAYKEPEADGRGAYHAVCTFQDARDILADCHARGMTRLTVVLVGWGQDGHDGMPPTRFPVDERLGGEAGLKNLAAWCRENDILLGLHDSYGGYYSCSPEFDVADLIRHRTGEYWQSIIWSGGQCHIACPKVYLDKQLKRDVPAIRALGIHGHHHIDAVGSFMTCYSKDHPLETRKEFTSEVRKMFLYAASQLGSVSTEIPFGPYLDAVDGFFHSYTKPSEWHRASSVGRFFLDRAIPLLPIVLHGSAACGESIGDYLDCPMEWLARGLSPNWELAECEVPTFGIPAYRGAADHLARIYAIYYGDASPLRRLASLDIEGRWELPDGLIRTRYSDGTIVLVNPTGENRGGLAAQTFEIEEIRETATPSAQK